MVKVPTPKEYGCERCGWEWLQRLQVNRKDGKIQSIKALDPQNCSKCKSPSWNVPRGH